MSHAGVHRGIRVPARRSRRGAGPLLTLALGLVASGCATSTPGDDGVVLDVDADSVAVRGLAADARTAPDGRPFEFRAVCMQAAEHDGRPYVLSKWLEDPAVPREMGHYHGDFKVKGHHWVLERRFKR